MRTREVDTHGRVVFRAPPLRVRVPALVGGAHAARGLGRASRQTHASGVTPEAAGGTPALPGPGRGRSTRIRFAWVAIAACLGLASSLTAAITAVGPINLVVADLDRVAAFYTDVLSFERVGNELREPAPAPGPLHAVPGARTRAVVLRLGDETITLTQFVGVASRPIPADSRSFDHWFQHIAIVVRDMDAAYAHLARHRVRHVSTAPQTLPAWNPDAGGIKAFYFQDPEAHVLEVIWFPPGRGDPRWQRPTGPLFLGIDHTAIVVSDSERSLACYRDALGLRVAGGAENHGVEQEHLNQVFGARLRITALRAPAGPGIEFLEYIAPPGGRPLPADARIDDLLAWNVTLASDAVPEDRAAVVRSGGRALPSSGAAHQLVRDPDGHLLRLEAAPPSDT